MSSDCMSHSPITQRYVAIIFLILGTVFEQHSSVFSQMKKEKKQEKVKGDDYKSRVEDLISIIQLRKRLLRTNQEY